ncbi:MAG: phage tail protein [Candidatus Galacturonibacter soehngenii]|nr:phage tail protein [Candidatus Galacturonibacter soehngenii]
MYKIKVITNGKTYTLHDAQTDDLVVISPKLTRELNKTGTLTFQITAKHPYYAYIHKLSSEIIVYDNEDEIFRGRALNDTADFYNSGKITCEGELAYLLDSLQRPFEYQGNIHDLLEAFLNVHNSHVEPRKQFKLGRVTVVDNNNYINRSNTDYSNTLAAINDKLIKTHEGYLNIRWVDGVRYLDYLNDFGHINSQTIRFGENILDLSKHIKADNVRTAIIPIGADIEDSGKVNITSVNNGKDYIYDENAVNQFGWIWDTVEFEDVTLPQNLLTKARAYLNDCINISTTIELSAIDLSLIDVNIEKIKMGDWIRVVSKPHNLDRLFLVTKYDLDLTKPQNNKITLGSVLTTLTSSTTKSKNDISEKVKQVAKSLSLEINEKVKNATQLITGGNGGYVVLNITEDGHTDEILIMDAPDKAQAKNVIRFNKNGIGFSTSGYNGTYSNAWTIDGNLIADFITTGSMLADRIRGGTLELGGTGLGKDGSILIRDSNNTIIATIDKNGVTASKGTFSDKVTGASITGGTITGSVIKAGNVESNTYDLEASSSGVRVRNRFYLQDYDGTTYMQFIGSGKGKLTISDVVLKLGSAIRLDPESNVAVFSTPQEIFIKGKGDSGGTWDNGLKKKRTLSDGTTLNAWDIGDVINFLAKRQIEEYNFRSKIDERLREHGLIK